MGKAHKKKTSRKKSTCGGKKKRFSRRKMKGGVTFNTSFSTSSLPSSTYIPLNPNVNDNPSWHQYAGRLLPEVVMKGGKKTRKRHGAKKTRKSRTHKKHGGSDTTPETASETEPSTLTTLYRKGHHFFRGDKTAGEKRKEKEICENVRDNYIRIDGYELWDYYYYDHTTEDRENSFLKDIVFYRHAGPPGCDLQELGTLSTDKKHAPYSNSKEKGNRVDRLGRVEPDIERGYLHFSNKKKFILAYMKTAGFESEYGGDLNEQYTLFYIKKDTINEAEFNEKDREAFNKIKVDQEYDPYLNVEDPDKHFYNNRNYYETWFVRSRLYGIVPDKDEYEIMKNSYGKQGLE